VGRRTVYHRLVVKTAATRGNAQID
jgi:hypothetical protein